MNWFPINVVESGPGVIITTNCNGLVSGNCCKGLQHFLLARFEHICCNPSLHYIRHLPHTPSTKLFTYGLTHVFPPAGLPVVDNANHNEEELIVAKEGLFTSTIMRYSTCVKFILFSIIRGFLNPTVDDAFLKDKCGACLYGKLGTMICLHSVGAQQSSNFVYCSKFDSFFAFLYVFILHKASTCL